MNILYNYRNDLKNPNDDPDKLSFNLKHIHSLLWSKPLPNGQVLTLIPRRDIIEAFIDGESVFCFNPDSFVNTLSNSTRMGFKANVDQWKKDNKEIDKELDKYYSLGYTIGESIIFPVRVISNTINKARGLHPSIQDRTDFTLECIRLHYLSEDNPLAECLNAHSVFFSWFGEGEEGFSNYVKWFCLDDLVSSDYKTVVPFTSTLSFNHPQPETEEEYLLYIQNVNGFVEKRNKRLLANYPNVFEKAP